MAQPTTPFLFLDTLDEQFMHLRALICATQTPKPLQTNTKHHAFTHLATIGTQCFWVTTFTLPLTGGTYTVEDIPYDVRGFAPGWEWTFVSCNGVEHHDLARDPEERNKLWNHLFERSQTHLPALLIHGGDQIYADEVTDLHPLTREWPKAWKDPENDAAQHSLITALEEGFCERYLANWAHPQTAWLCARIPSVMQWDDHDICDGWGSLPRKNTNSLTGKILFGVARRMALLFQHGCDQNTLPKKFWDPTGQTLSWSITGDGWRLLAPDLRSERTRKHIMFKGWGFVEDIANTAFEGHTFFLSTVPLLGPRLSVLEKIMMVIPKMQKYEDDLRDQWQSRTHRDSWIKMLGLCERLHTNGLTILSGEIHLAAHAKMPLSSGKSMTQLIASGITHPAPPNSLARLLNSLTWLGEGPLKPITFPPLPGHKRIYVNERNTLTIHQSPEGYTAQWYLENSGNTPPILL